MKKKRTRSQIGKLSRNKGRSFEQLIVKKFKAAGINAERGYWQSTGGNKVPDVILRDIPSVWLELGHGNSINPENKLTQALNNSPSSAYPIAICRKNNSDILCYLDVNTLNTLLLKDTYPSIHGKYTVVISFNTLIRVLSVLILNI